MLQLAKERHAFADDGPFARTSEAPLLSVIVPTFREKDNVEELVRRIACALKERLGKSFLSITIRLTARLKPSVESHDGIRAFAAFSGSAGGVSPRPASKEFWPAARPMLR